MQCRAYLRAVRLVEQLRAQVGRADGVRILEHQRPAPVVAVDDEGEPQQKREQPERTRDDVALVRVLFCLLFTDGGALAAAADQDAYLHRAPEQEQQQDAEQGHRSLREHACGKIVRPVSPYAARVAMLTNSATPAIDMISAMTSTGRPIRNSFARRISWSVAQ
ncbi:hypothetical protein PMI02_04682 [Novosphingobium sp. AP12]|nr:hypothetical protein PMI02_04682 [Novosphingobium sp. AP12]